MKSFLFIGVPLIVIIGLGLYTDFITYGDQHPGVVHVAGVPFGGTFSLIQEDTYVCDSDGANCTLVDSTTEFSEVDGLEVEEGTIEYRDGASNDYNKTKQPGIPKFSNIYMKRPTSFDFDAWKFIVAE